MIDGIIFFGIGYFFARAIQPQFSAEFLLYWNKECMAWRPVADKQDIKPGERYRAAFEVELEKAAEIPVAK